MDVFLAKHQETMKRAIKGVEQYDRDLKALSAWWEKIALIGKINSLEVASTILEDMENTLSQFHHLQKTLIQSLTNEHSRKAIVQDQSRCQVAIDVLIRNLFERTADIGFLSTDVQIIDFINHFEKYKHDGFAFRQRLQAYVDIYSVYRDVVLLAPDGELLFQLSQPSRTGKMQDNIIQQAINNPDRFVEYFGTTELMAEAQANLLYANAVVDSGQVIGVIVLCFRFRNELEGIVDRLVADDDASYFALLDGANQLLFTSLQHQKVLPKSLLIVSEPEILSTDGEDMVQVCAKGQAYQGYAGPENWHMCALLPVAGIEKNASTQSHSTQGPSLQDISGLISDDLFDIRHRSTLINDDLELIVLNGIITAARKEAVEFMPVLEAIKKIGRDIDSVFADSIESLFSTIISSQLNAMRLQASLAVDIMDRNLFERANDCRWWGLSTLLQSALASSPVDKESIELTLAKIHSLYTVYHTLYVYDQQGHYVAFSDARYKHKIGQRIEQDSGGQAAFQLQDIYGYNVSPFVPFDCYEGEPTYIYNAAIRDINQPGNIIGGIGIVFDSTVEFKAILDDILPRENGVIKAGSRALFTTEYGLILSSTEEGDPIGGVFQPDMDMTELNEEGVTSMLIRLEDGVYLLGAAKSKGYREFKRDDGYDNTVIAWVLMPC